ncbi:MAG: nuclear transport factor 2 family protein, partial [Gammaproteobacteria bacterium]|nr:nuclear transport factor 2 family protein [Gammaproteobacteria bacterium]
MSEPHPFRSAVEARDLGAMLATLSDDVVFWSPLAFEPFRGKPMVGRLLQVLLNEIFEDFRYTDELVGDDGTHALIFRARVGDREVQ